MSRLASAAILLTMTTVVIRGPASCNDCEKEVLLPEGRFTERGYVAASGNDFVPSATAGATLDLDAALFIVTRAYDDGGTSTERWRVRRLFNDPDANPNGPSDASR